MIRKIIKLVLFSIILIVGVTSFTIAKHSGVGVLPLAIISIGMFAALKAIWNYNPSPQNEITLNKED